MRALALAAATRASAAAACLRACSTAAVAPWTSELVVSTLVFTLTLVMGTLTVAWMAAACALARLAWACSSGDLIVLGIDLGDGRPDVDLLVVVDVDLDDLAGDAGADLIEIAVDLGVVGVFGEGGAPVEDARADDEEDDDRDDDELAARLLRWDFVLVRPVGVGLPIAVRFDLHGAADLCGLGVLMFYLLWQVTFLRDNLCNLSARRPWREPAKAWLRCADRAR